MARSFITYLACFFVLVANAQDITENDLLGQWKIVSITEPDMHLDFIANTSKITEKFIRDNPEYSRKEVEELGNDRLDYLRGLHLIFAPDHILFMTSSNEEPTHFKYTLVTKAGRQYLVYEDTGGMDEIYMKDSLLYKILITGETRYIEVYKKERL